MDALFPLLTLLLSRRPDLTSHRRRRATPVFCSKQRYFFSGNLNLYIALAIEIIKFRSLRQLSYTEGYLIHPHIHDMTHDTHQVQAVETVSPNKSV